LPHALVCFDVRAAKTIDRLLRVADHEERARERLEPPPVALHDVPASQVEDDLGLNRIGVLKLVDEDRCEATLKIAAGARMVAEKIARQEKKVLKVQTTGSQAPGPELGDGGKDGIDENRIEKLPPGGERRRQHRGAEEIVFVRELFRL